MKEVHGEIMRANEKKKCLHRDWRLQASTSGEQATRMGSLACPNYIVPTSPQGDSTQIP
jgi:hypothetical protein